MSKLPIGANIPSDGAMGEPNSPTVQARYGSSGFYSQFVGAELVASKYGISRLDMDEFATASHARAAAAQAEGRFDGEVVVRDREHGHALRGGGRRREAIAAGEQPGGAVDGRVRRGRRQPELLAQQPQRALRVVHRRVVVAELRLQPVVEALLLDATAIPKAAYEPAKAARRGVLGGGRQTLRDT